MAAFTRTAGKQALTGLLCLLTAGVVLRAETVVFEDGKALLPVYVAAEAAPDEKLAAAELARVLGVMSGMEWPVSTESARGGAGLYVGHTQRAAALLPALRVAKDLLAPTADEIGPDGFRIRTWRGSIFIEGATPEATPFAVSWLLQREAGVRWYAPGEIGEVIPRREAWTLRDMAVVREPAYVSREIHGLRGEAGDEWARRNGLRRRLEYSHNLTNVFTPEVYDAHPEWFGMFGGVRRRPLGKGEYHWQPELSRADVATFAGERAAAVLAREPGRASFALGVNDTVRFDQGEGTRAVVEPLRYFRGKPDYSPLIFGFMNRAAETMARHPGLENRYLGCLAYFWCENPPPFGVDPHVVPYVTTDRTQFYDPAYRAADFALMSRWGRSGVRAFGLWEYAEGNAFLIPRVPHAALAGAVREGWWRGARGYMGECGPHAGFDAFKIWMLAQLMWEPTKSDEELAADFFGGMYGPAAEPMRRFFARCEEVWMAQSGPPWWIKFYQQQDQVLLFPPEVCAELRALLEEAGKRAETNTNLSGTQEIRNGTVGQGSDLAPDGGVRNDECGNQGIRNGTGDGSETRTRSATEFRISVHQCASVVNPDSKPGTPNRFAAAVCLTSRAFAVTEAAVEFDRIRRELVAECAAGLSAAELGKRLAAWQHARAALERAIQAATTGNTPAMATANIGYMLRNDPVPGLLTQLARGEAKGPQVALAEITAAGGAVPEHWRALAATLADAHARSSKNVLSNAGFAIAAATGQEPRFLFPLSGEVPAQWELRAAPTEHGRVALGPLIDGARALRIEGAWDTQLLQAQPVQAGALHVAEARMRGRSSPGNDAALFLAFLDAAGARVGEYRTVMLPKGESDWRTLVLADVAPEGARYVVVGVSALRQFGGDWLEVTGIALRAIQTADDRGRRADCGELRMRNEQKGGDDERTD